ncbi:hypothetical protein KBD71_02510 [Candidatus Woesebacteria bacterium]|nr:hypothetical protein [Candidatus Woesebacteria bacterium]
MRSPSLYWIILSSLALLFLCASIIPGVQSATQPFHRAKEQHRTAILAFLANEFSSIGMQTSGSKLSARLAALEQENRTLFAALATVSAQRENVITASTSPTVSASARLGVLSRDLSGWFVIQDIPQIIAAQTLIFQQGVVVGEVSATSSGVLPVVVVSERSAPLLVLHQPSQQIGTLTLHGKTPLVEFFERSDGISVGDLFTTLQSRTQEPAAAIGKVEVIKTQPSDPVSVVQLQFIAHPKVGDRVEVGR